MKRVLFVDDEQKVLDGLKRMLYPMRNEWAMTFVSSGHDALDALSRAEYDLMITDLRMPGMNGIELLTEVVKSYPEVVRIVLSGTADQEITLRSTALAHQFLLKPCDTSILRNTVDRAFKLRAMFESPEMKQVVSTVHKLPSVPALYVQLVNAIQSPDSSAAEIGRLIKQDVGMTAKVLQLVNSAFFGVRRQIADPAEAVIYLGAETLRELVLVASVFSSFRPKPARNFSIEAQHSHSLAVGSLARNIAKSLGLAKADIDYAYVGGLLHAVGKLVLACEQPVKYEAVLKRAAEAQIPERFAELEIFGTTHAEVGAYLLWLWNIPDPITEVVLRHHEAPPERRAPATPSIIVYLADALVHKGSEEAQALEYLTAIGLQEELAEWAHWN
ncbi:MAG: response regulator [Bryobacteraceae bacterium]